MSTLAPMIDAWVEGHREFSIALEGVADEDLWRRAHPRLLSIGELSAHIAYAQGVWILGPGGVQPDLAELPIQSPLLDHAVRYYPYNVEAPFQLEMGTDQLLAEVMRIHEAAKSSLANREQEHPHPNWETWGNLMQYQAFHVAYHTGQIYSVRQLMGHETPDN